MSPDRTERRDNNELQRTRPGFARSLAAELSVLRTERDRRFVIWLTRVLCVTLLFGVTAGCAGPTDEQVRHAFLREHPTAVVTLVASGEGDGSTVYKHIRYRLPGRTQECEIVWGYQQAEPEWRVFHWSEPGLSGTLCETCTPSPCQ